MVCLIATNPGLCTRLGLNTICDEIIVYKGDEKMINTKDKHKGIVEIIVNNKIYKCWISANIVKKYIRRFLKERFPESIVAFEINHIDIVVFDNKYGDIIPVETQTTQASPNLRFKHTQFEKEIRKQLEDNIENYEKCWLFFDSEYLRYLQSGDISTNTSMNMNWLVKYMKENKLKVFVIRYDGEMIKELSTKDFDFLIDISMTCPLGHDNDDRVLNRNKLKIFRDVLKGYNFRQDDIDKIYDKIYDNESNDIASRFLIRDGDKREKLYGHIMRSANDLMSINEILDMNMTRDYGKMEGTYLGIFDVEGMGPGSITRFVDRFYICKHFPGYLRNKDMWDKLKVHSLNHRQFKAIVTKKININKGIDYFWYEK